jgi:hypothetical protein
VCRNLLLAVNDEIAGSEWRRHVVAPLAVCHVLKGLTDN